MTETSPEMEIPVEIRRAIDTRVSNPLARAAMTDLTTVPVVFESTDMCCEDCPEVLDNPPDESDCPYFFKRSASARPECDREDSHNRQIRRFFFGT